MIVRVITLQQLRLMNKVIQNKSCIWNLYSKQLNTTEGHEKVKDFKIVVNGNSPQTIRYSLSNAPITAKLKLVKTDSESGRVIPFQNVTFKIKNVDTDEYVCQK